MKEQEAQQILAEHRSVCPQFVRGSRLYKVRRDGRTVDVYRLTGRKQTAAIFEHTTTADDNTVHPDVRERLR